MFCSRFFQSKHIATAVFIIMLHRILMWYQITKMGQVTIYGNQRVAQSTVQHQSNHAACYSIYSVASTMAAATVQHRATVQHEATYTVASTVVAATAQHDITA